MDSDKDIYFPHLDNFSHGDIFKNIEQVWDPLKLLKDLIQKILTEDKVENSIKTLIGIRADSSASVKSLIVENWIKLKSPFISEDLGIRIGSGTTLEPTAIIKGPAVIGKNNDIRQGAYIRGNVIVGDHCVIGHCTEIKSSILMNYVEAGHFNYIGDSILGSYVNMGAGSRLANVQFRTLKEKMGNLINEIVIPLENKLIASQLSKFGSIIGDNTEIGCNAVLCPGTLLGKDNWVYPNCTLPKGFYPPGHFLSPADHKLRSRPK